MIFQTELNALQKNLSNGDQSDKSKFDIFRIIFLISKLILGMIDLFIENRPIPSFFFLQFSEKYIYFCHSEKI